MYMHFTARVCNFNPRSTISVKRAYIPWEKTLVSSNVALHAITYSPTVCRTVAPQYQLQGGEDSQHANLQFIFRKRATNYRALLREMTHKDEASSGSSPPCTAVHSTKRAGVALHQIKRSSCTSESSWKTARVHKSEHAQETMMPTRERELSSAFTFISPSSVSPSREHTNPPSLSLTADTSRKARFRLGVTAHSSWSNFDPNGIRWLQMIGWLGPRFHRRWWLFGQWVLFLERIIVHM